MIGSLLFLILIGDIDQDVALSFLKSFTDDTRLLQEVNGVQDASALQSDLEANYKWAVDNNASSNDKYLRFSDMVITTLRRFTLHRMA